MKTLTKVYWLFFLIVSIFHLLFIGLDNTFWIVLSKYFLIPPLIMIAWGLGKDKSLLVLALAFSWLGDILLAQQKFGPNFFIFGLLAFLTAHVFYIAMNIKTVGKIVLNAPQFIVSIPMLLWAMYLLNQIGAHASNFFIPIIFYSIALCGLYFSAVLNFSKIGIQRFMTLFAGVILFIASDSMIAINRFLSKFDNSDFAIMLTYILAQALIVWSFCQNDKIAHNTKIN